MATPSGFSIVTLDRRPKTEEELADLRKRLHEDSRIVKGRGHDWDVADIMAVVEVWNEDNA